MERWEKELSRYSERLAKIENWSPDLSAFVVKLPEIPLRYIPSPKGLVALNLSLYALACIRVANQSRAAFLKLWEKNLFAVIALPARFLFELWGSSHYALKILLQMHESGDVNKAMDRSKRLLLGARSEVFLPWGPPVDIKSVHVMDFVRSLTDTYPQAENTYDFLCESCHPSYLRLTSWSLMSPPVHNWTNERFREEAHTLIEHTLQAVEQALEGIYSDVTDILKASLPYIEADKSRNTASGH
ncbi:MAG: hypothetical protein AB1507_04735 [Bacillota bacterium]|jgi:hypothetical protein